MSSSKEDNRRYRENMRRKAIGLPPIRKKVINDYTVTLPIPIPTIEHRKGYIKYEEMTMALDRIADRLQKRMKKEWARISSKPFIIIVQPGNKVKGEEKMNFKIELDQLNLDKETMDMFKAVCEKIHKDSNGFLDFQEKNCKLDNGGQNYEDICNRHQG